ncbi:MAG: acyl carrier protein [Clostridiaceae bacterium]|nr:acyl carrier protein [Clostridiaceae bacterium]
MIFEKVKEIIAETMGITEEEIAMDSHLIDDLGADSIDAVELSISIEETFDLDLDDDDILKFEKVSDIVEFLENNN